MWLRECPNLDQGLLRPIVSAEGTVVLFCDSADCVWLRPDEVTTRQCLDLDPADWSVAPEIHLTPGTTRWADPEDVPGAWRTSFEWQDG